MCYTSGQWGMYRVYRNYAAALIHPFIFFIFLSLQFSSIKIFVGVFSKTEAKKVETSYKHEEWVVVLCLPKSGGYCLFIPLVLHFSFSPIFKY